MLDGVVVLDLSRLFPGPLCTLVLSDLGAEVIKVEDEKGGDYARYYPPLLEDGNGAVFHALNRGKKSVSLDLKTDEGRAGFFRLLETADVVVESFRPGVLEKLGLGPAALAAKKPGIIVCRISGYGQDSDDKHLAGHDLNYATKAGVLGLMKDPTALPVQVADVAGGAWPAATQILAALVQRNRTGQGAVLDVSMTDSVRDMLIMARARQLAFGEDVTKGRDWLAGALPCYRVYPTKQGHLAVGALEPKFWTKFCGGVGLPDLVSNGHDQGADADAAIAAITARLSEKTALEWEAHLAPYDCCVTAVRGPDDAGSVTIAVAGQDVTLPGLALPAHKALPGPGLGAHNRELLGDEP